MSCITFRFLSFKVRLLTCAFYLIRWCKILVILLNLQEPDYETFSKRPTLKMQAHIHSLWSGLRDEWKTELRVLFSLTWLFLFSEAARHVSTSFRLLCKK